MFFCTSYLFSFGHINIPKKNRSGLACTKLTIVAHLCVDMSMIDMIGEMRKATLSFIRWARYWWQASWSFRGKIHRMKDVPSDRKRENCKIHSMFIWFDRFIFASPFIVINISERAKMRFEEQIYDFSCSIVVFIPYCAHVRKGNCELFKCIWHSTFVK